MPEMLQPQTFLFADLVGYTALTAERGDEAAAELAVGFTHAAAVVAADHGGELVKAMGDGVMVHGASVTDTVWIGLYLVATAAASPACPALRVGIHSGPAVPRGGDWYGTTVNLAARLMRCASAGEVLVSETTNSHLGSVEGLQLVDRGVRHLRGATAPTAVFAVSAPRPRPPTGAVPVLAA